MPIYAYRCDECGFPKDVLQKISDPVLTTCLSCNKPAFKKQVTAAGFQLKGSGWYVTDFRGNSGSVANSTGATGTALPATEAPASGDAGSGSAAPAAAPAASTPAAPAAAPAAAAPSAPKPPSTPSAS